MLTIQYADIFHVFQYFIYRTFKLRHGISLLKKLKDSIGFLNFGVSFAIKWLQFCTRCIFIQLMNFDFVYSVGNCNRKVRELYTRLGRCSITGTHLCFLCTSNTADGVRFFNIYQYSLHQKYSIKAKAQDILKWSFCSWGPRLPPQFRLYLSCPTVKPVWKTFRYFWT